MSSAAAVLHDAADQAKEVVAHLDAERGHGEKRFISNMQIWKIILITTSWLMFTALLLPGLAGYEIFCLASNAQKIAENTTQSIWTAFSPNKFQTEITKNSLIVKSLCKIFDSFPSKLQSTMNRMIGSESFWPL
ncbi:MAG: hypothetical protein KGJ02_03465 [Verrucomicrobiota bacterium]|nr:hypothetical protein [Verrucomicrobiota bacterium]